MEGGGGREKNGVGRKFSKVTLIDALHRGWIEEWNGVGLGSYDWRRMIGEW